MDYHGRIMNIECLPPARMNQHPVDPECSAYRIGHRDARHAAAEIACEAQAEIARLREALEKLCEMADESDGAQYGTLGTNFVRGIARAALAPAAEVTRESI